MQSYQFKSLKVTLREVVKDGFVAEVGLNRPEKYNAMNFDVWNEVPLCMEQLSQDPYVRCIIFYGEGKCFSSGLDLGYAATKITKDEDLEATRFAFEVRRFIKWLQDSCSSLEKCTKPVIAATHSLVIGGALEMILNADIRIASADAKFTLKEIELGFASDLGGLQRLSSVCGSSSWVREVVFTGREFDADEALRNGLVSQVLPNRDAMMAKARELADNLARKSPVALVGTKYALNHARDNGVLPSLELQTVWNSWAIQAPDVKTAIGSVLSKGKIPAAFPKL